MNKLNSEKRKIQYRKNSENQHNLEKTEKINSDEQIIKLRGKNIKNKIQLRIKENKG